MPSKKKKSKAKGRKPAAGKGGIKGADNAAAGEQQKQGTLDSEMQRLRIGEQQAGDGGVDALLEEAIKLAAVEQLEIEENKKENCTHGYNPSSRFQARICEDFSKTFKESCHASRREGDSRIERLKSITEAFLFAATTTTMTKTTSASTKKSDAERVNPFCLAEGTKFILDGKSDDARLCAVVAMITKSVSAGELPSQQKQLELIDGDEHTLVQFFRKQIPCSCLDEKYNEVKSITKMGVCYNEKSCPLPDRKTVRSKMLKCTGCTNGRNVSYCSRKCQEAHWPQHKYVCGKTVQEIAVLHPKLRGGEVEEY
jgi:hypothetical protein